MAIAFVGGKTVASVSGLGVTTAAYADTGANLFLAAVGSWQTSGPPTISDSNSNTPYVDLTASVVAGDNYSRISYFLNPTVDGSVTGSAADSGGSGFFYPGFGHAAFSGVKVTSAFDQQNGTTGAGVTSVQHGSVTPSEDGELLIATICLNGAFTNLSINSGFTIIDAVVAYSAGNNYGFAFAYLVQGTAAAINPTWSWTTARGVATTIATFKREPGGGGSVVRHMLAHEHMAARSFKREQAQKRWNFVAMVDRQMRKAA